MIFLENINWVDIFIGAIIVRTLYIGLKKGVILEFFKIVGVFMALFITLHYFNNLAKSLPLPEGVGNFVAYLFLWGIITLVFKFVRDAFTMLFKIEAHSVFDRWGGLILAFLRSILTCSLTIVFLNISGIKYFQKNTVRSFSGSHLVSLAPKIYEATFDGFIIKFFPTERLNKEAFPFNRSQEEKK